MSKTGGTWRRKATRHTLLLVVFAIMLLGVVAPAYALNTATWSGAAPAAGAIVLVKPTAPQVVADDTAPITRATVTLNGSAPTFVNLDYFVGHSEYDEEAESDIWIVDDWTVARITGYFPASKILTGTNTLVTTVTSSKGVSTYTRTFTYGAVTTVSSISPGSDAVLPASPPAIAVGLSSGASSFTSVMRLDGVIVPTTYTAATKTFTHVPSTTLSPGTHTVAFAATDSSGGSVSRTWSFRVAPPMSNAAECGVCHSGYPAAHPVADCSACHSSAYAPAGTHGGEVPTAAGCSGDGGSEQDDACHNLEHREDGVWGIWGAGPFDCADCHSATYPAVPRHTETAVNAAHVSSIGCGGTCHSASLVAEHGKYPAGSVIKYQCDLCHGVGARTDVKAAVAADDTSCDACHATYHADFEAQHTAPTAACSGAGCHATTKLVDAHEAYVGAGGRYPQYETTCALCHENEDPNRVPANATADCASCHPDRVEPHGADPADHTAGGQCVTSGCHDPNVAVIHATPTCAACHAAGSTPSLVCSDCHSGNLHPTADHTSSVTCDACHSTANIVTIHGDNCALCHAQPVDSMGAWNQTCEQSGCHAEPLHPGVDYHGDDHGEGSECWSCHEYGWGCTDCHGHEYDRTLPTTTSNVQATYAGVAHITLYPTDPQVYGAPPGGWGVKATYYQVDGGPLQTGTTISVAGPAAGEDPETHTIEFWSLDNRGNTESPHKKATFIISDSEHIPPVTTSNAVSAYTGPATITLIPTDVGGSGLRATYYRLDGGPQQTGTSVSVPAPPYGSPAVSHSLEFWSEDWGANVETPHNTVSFTVAPAPDGTPPSGTMSVNGGAANTRLTAATVNSAVTDAQSGMSQMQIDPGNGTYGPLMPYAPSQAFTLSSGDGIKTVRVRYTDASGNALVRTDTIRLDTVAPVTTSNIVGGTTYTGAQTFVLTATDVGGSGVASTRWQLDGTTGSWSSGTSVLVAAPSSGTAAHTLYWYATDSATNQEVTKSVSFAIEAAPSGTGTTTLSNVNGYTWVDANEGASGAWATYSIYVNDTLIDTKNATADPTWTCPPINLPTGGHVDIVVDCGFSSYAFLFGEGRPNTYTITLPAGTTRLEAATWTGFPDMNVTTDYWEPYDDMCTWVDIGPFTISNIVYGVGGSGGGDATAPTGSVSVNSGAAYAASTAVNLTLSATDTGGSGLSHMRFSNDNSSWSTWETYATTKSWTLTPGNGVKTVYAQYRDNAGNISTSFSDGITLDGTAPTGSISINGGAATASSTSVTLGLSATDTGGSALHQMRFSNDNTNWSTWEAYSATKSWSLTGGDGAKTVYAQYRDNVGNVSASYSDGIVLVTGSGTTATLAFVWHPADWAEAHLRVKNASGVTITDTWVSGWGSDLDLSVVVPAGQDYYMECVYYYDEYNDDEGGPYGKWTYDTSINADGVVAAGETVIWYY